MEWCEKFKLCLSVVQAGELDCAIPAGVPEFGPRLVVKLLQCVDMPEVSFDECPSSEPVQRRSFQDIEDLITWALHLLRTGNVGSYWWPQHEDTEAKISNAVMGDVFDWESDTFNSATALVLMSGNERGYLPHDRFPGCPNLEIQALPEHLVAALGFVSFNRALECCDKKEFEDAMGYVAASYECALEASSCQEQHVGHMISDFLNRRMLRARGSKGGLAKNLPAEKLKAWVDQQPNPTKRTDRPFARQLAKAVPVELANELADPERVIYDHLRSLVKNTAN